MHVGYENFTTFDREGRGPTVYREHCKLKIQFMQGMTFISSSNVNQLHFSKCAYYHKCTFELSSVSRNAGLQSLTPFDRRQNFLYFLYIPISRRFGVTAWKRNCRKQKLVAIATSLGDRNWGSDRSSTAIAETNGENPMKIHPVEDAIVGLTEIVKKERNDTEAKHSATQ